MPSSIRRATTEDLVAIQTVLGANQNDASLFQQPRRQIRRTLSDFFVAEAEDGRVEGCSALHWYAGGIAEILAVAVHPSLHGTGVGTALIQALIAEARAAGASLIWLGTAKPDYFARFGFRPVSRWMLPLRVLVHKLLLVFQQRPSRWLPAIAGRHRFMALPGQ